MDQTKIEAAANPESLEGIKDHWKNYSVAVMSASSDKNIPAKENAKFIGGLLAEEGYDGRNGGYSAGAMKEFADGFREKCRSLGMKDEEIKKHFFGVIFSDKAIGEGLKKIRGVNEITTTTISEEGHDWWSRSGGISNPSDAIIVLEGGIGTFNEGSGNAMGEYFAQQKNAQIQKELSEAAEKGKLTEELSAKKNSEKVPIKPIISLDATHAFTDALELLEQRSPGTVDTITPNVYVLTGHSNPNIASEKEGIRSATAKNDPVVGEQIKMILRYYYLMNQKEKLTNDQENEQEALKKKLFDSNSPFKVQTLKEHWQSKKEFSDKGGI